MSLADEPLAWIEGHVTGRIPQLDVAEMKQEPCVVLHERYSGEQLRRATYFHHLAGNPTELRRLFVGTGIDAQEFSRRWFAFINERLSNVRRSDHPDNGGSQLVMQRVYTPPRTGKPGRLICTNSLQDIYELRSILVDRLLCDRSSSPKMKVHRKKIYRNCQVYSRSSKTPKN